MGGSEVRAGERPIPVLGLLVAVQGQGERLPGSGGEGELVWQTMSAAPPLPPLPSSHLPSPPLPSRLEQLQLEVGHLYKQYRKEADAR